MGYPISVTPLGPLELGCRFIPTIPLHKHAALLPMMLAQPHYINQNILLTTCHL